MNVSNLTFRTFRGLAGLRLIAEMWHRILGSIESPEFFHQYAWYEEALTTTPAIAENTHFIVVEDGKTPLAICPLQLSRTRTLRMPVRVLSTIDPHSVSYSDFVCARGLNVLPHVIEELRKSKHISWDLLVLPKCLHTAAVDPASDQLADIPGLFRHAWDVCYYISCDDGMEACYDRMSSKMRYQLRKGRKQLAQAGKLEFLSTRDPALLPGYLEEFLTLEASGWKGMEGTAIKCSPDLIRFYKRVVDAFGKSRQCEINLMQVSGRNIAGDLALLSDGKWNQLKTAYDEEHGKTSPGYVMLDGIFTRLCDDANVHTASILTGAEWAARLGARELTVWRVVARNATMRGSISLQEVKLRHFVHNAARRISSSLGL